MVKNVESVDTGSAAGLPSWRSVIEPHPDVAKGRYKNAEFAADLAAVARGEGAPEYGDPAEFFARTYITSGMAGLLGQALRRVCGLDGEPVIQLKTAFGGGKTHSMLALYHIMGGAAPVGKIPDIRPVLERAGVGADALPKANIAVLVGTALDPTTGRHPSDMPGVAVNTLWGEMAAQIAASAGRPELYDIVKESDKKGVSPGSEALKNLFDAAAPCLILMDELVAYARKIYGVDGLPAGTFDNFISFVQEVTEAARASRNSLVVASIPESDIEIGGEAGKAALKTIEHTFGRMESIWKPVAAGEGFEVVRRRLFLNCGNPDGRDKVCAAFSKMYNENDTDFPAETKELEYKGRMASCYPIHPEVFDRLYGDWSTLDGFQRTRGVLRLMAAVIHELWMGNDAGLMIMPGSIPLYVSNVRDELTKHLSEGWNAVVDHEVDGKISIPFQKDESTPRYGGKSAARRVARTVMLGSAPTDRNRSVRGIEASRIRLGAVQPGDSIAVFNDALSMLASSLTYLYANPSGDRFWYDTRPTLRKTAEDRATQVSAFDAEREIEERLKKIRKEPPFAGVHVCPASSLDVPDEQCARLVLLRPVDEYRPSEPGGCAAMKAVQDILNNRDKSPRIYRNTLAFVAPDQDAMASLKQAARLYLAWKSVKADSADLNLDAAQNRETDGNLGRADRTVDDRVKEAYCWLLVPYINKDDMKTVAWEPVRISGGGDSVIAKAAKSMRQNETIVTQWAPALLKMELDSPRYSLWREAEHISVKRLWDDLCTYCYLPRLVDFDVLEKAIREGLDSNEYFAYAAAVDGEGGRYMGLKLNQRVDAIERSGYLVKISAAQKQIAEEEAKRQKEEMTYSVPPKTGDAVGPGVVNSADNVAVGVTLREDPATAALPKRFNMSADIDNERINHDVGELVNEVIRHLTVVDGARVKVTLEVDAEADGGFTQSTVRTVTENCRTLGVRVSGFE